ncbi:hypothetical protein L596_017253 [Steinernema carpocapsae]|uniref:Uncharacterized protein n=1 Tax=Steinernema carpocapsae TaxID=34508 RepID=A0A4U5N1V2_STECR|nr:hypothetical protein L596_017253 [Steinernema carpocapsae]
MLQGFKSPLDASHRSFASSSEAASSAKSSERSSCKLQHPQNRIAPLQTAKFFPHSTVSHHACHRHSSFRCQGVQSKAKRPAIACPSRATFVARSSLRSWHL